MINLVQNILLILLVFTSITGEAVSGKVFNFSTSLDSWANWGEGVFKLDKRIGRSLGGSLHMTSGFGAEHNLYRKFSNLENGTYRITYFLKGVDLYNEKSLWNFVNTGKGTKTIFEKFQGNFEWRKISYSVDISNGELEFWLRLRGAGQVFFDDFSLRKVRKKEKLAIHDSYLKKDPRSLKFGGQNQCEKEGNFWHKKHKYCPRCGANFLKNHFVKNGLPFDILSSGIPVPFLKGEKNEFEIKPREFYNFNFESVNIDWEKYRYITFEVFNPNEEPIDFTFVLGDHLSKNYWSQLNHTASLGKGKNSLTFSLKNYVGERGSVRYFRTLNFKSIKKMFVIVDQDEKHRSDKKVRISKMSLQNFNYPKAPTGLKGFDFTNHKAPTLNGLIPVTTMSKYTKERRFGFRRTKFWKTSDAKYASSIDRNTIDVHEGEFVIDLPNGEYEILLTINALGYWDTNFWSYRSVDINGETLVLEKRSSVNEYLADLLQFQDTEPKYSDNPFDLYHNQIFKKIKKRISVVNGRVVLSFKGNETGIRLNSFYVWPVKLNSLAKKYFEESDKMRKKELNILSRKLEPLKSKKKEKFGVVNPKLTLSPVSGEPINSKEAQIIGASGESPFVIIQIPKLDQKTEFDISWNTKDHNSHKLSQNKARRNDTIFKSVKLHLLKNQYVSRDMNHETYEIFGKYLEPLQGKVSIDAGENRYIMLGIQINENHLAGKYHGVLRLKSQNISYDLKTSLTIINATLPKINFPVGFIGLDPLPKSYFQGEGKAKFYQDIRLKSLRIISEKGFTSYSGLPGISSGDGAPDASKIKVVDDIFKQAKKLGLNGPVLSYGGDLLFEYLDDLNVIKKNSKLMAPLLSRQSWPTIIHVFSDEASGYSNKVEADLFKVKKIKKDFPSLKTGVFSHMAKDLHYFNKEFDYGIYSSVKSVEASKLNKIGQKWGLYNLSSGAIDDPRFVFGLGLRLARNSGASFYFDWHLSAFQNYPYFDLDGREGDISMLYPRKNAQVYTSLKFEMAAQGLSLFRKILLMEEVIKDKIGNKEGIHKAKKWMHRMSLNTGIFNQKKLDSLKSLSFEKLNSEVNQILLQVFP